jgi:hypothetical protein
MYLWACLPGILNRLPDRHISSLLLTPCLGLLITFVEVHAGPLGATAGHVVIYIVYNCPSVYNSCCDGCCHGILYQPPDPAKLLRTGLMMQRLWIHASTVDPEVVPGILWLLLRC